MEKDKREREQCLGGVPSEGEPRHCPSREPHSPILPQSRFKKRAMPSKDSVQNDTSAANGQGAALGEVACVEEMESDTQFYYNLFNPAARAAYSSSSEEDEEVIASLKEGVMPRELASEQCSQALDDEDGCGSDTQFQRDLCGPSYSMVFPHSRFRRASSPKPQDNERKAAGDGVLCTLAAPEPGSDETTSKELVMYKGVPECFGLDKPTSQSEYPAAFPCSWPLDELKYCTEPVRACVLPGQELTATRPQQCCGKAHYRDISVLLSFRNKVQVPVALTHVAITRLLRVEAADLFTSDRSAQQRTQDNLFRAIDEGPQPVFWCQSKNDCLRVTAVRFKQPQ